MRQNFSGYWLESLSPKRPSIPEHRGQSAPKTTIARVTRDQLPLTTTGLLDQLLKTTYIEVDDTVVVTPTDHLTTTTDTKNDDTAVQTPIDQITLRSLANTDIAIGHIAPLAPLLKIGVIKSLATVDEEVNPPVAMSPVLSSSHSPAGALETTKASPGAHPVRRGTPVAVEGTRYQMLAGFTGEQTLHKCFKTPLRHVTRGETVRKFYGYGCGGLLGSMAIHVEERIL